MRLASFQVRKFRNIVDSGRILVSPAVTCLVGKNEAGKSGLLEALYLLWPAYKDEPVLEDQYPRWLAVRDRKQGDLGKHAFVEAEFQLDREDLATVANRLGENVLSGDTLVLKRRYNGGTVWAFDWSESSAIKSLLASMPSRVRDYLGAMQTLQEVRDRLETLKADPPASACTPEDVVEAQRRLVEREYDKDDVWHAIVNLLKAGLPRFFRFTGYNTLPGRVDFRDVQKANKEGPGQSGLQTARALLELAGTDISQLTNDDYELRKAELEAVQIDLSNQVFEYWKQNPDLEVLIDVDKATVESTTGQTSVARFLDIRLRDKRTGYSNNFSQRSSGFQWFFSFLAAFSEFESKEPTIVLLDEPALALHGRAQADFLRFINERLAPVSTVLYTTHSPFMIEPGSLEHVRVVEDLGPPEGAVVRDDVLASDPDSLFPLQAALGYDIAQNLFVGPHNLVVEGTSEYIYLTVMSLTAAETEGTSLDSRWRILPAGGASNIPSFVSLVGPHLDVTVLADSDTRGMQRVTNMVERGLLAKHRLVLASVARESDHADIEDLFSEGDYLKLYNKTFGTTLKLAELPAGNRITKRLEALRGEPFNHGEVAEEFLRTHQDSKFTDTTLERFTRLFEVINATLGAK